MKYLEYTGLARLNSFLAHVNLGDYVIRSSLEAYSCKLAGIDKKLSRSLDAEVAQELTAAGSPQSLAASSPLGPLADSSSRRTLIYLILTLNHLYPDHDFSALRPQHFDKAGGVGPAKDSIDGLLVEAARAWAAQHGAAEPPLLEELWRAVEEVIELPDCDVYVYKPDPDSDPFSEAGSRWLFNYFFYNRKLKRILYFSARSQVRASLAGGEDSDSADGGGDADFADTMDMGEADGW